MEVGDVFGVDFGLDGGDVAELSFPDVFVFDHIVHGALLPAVLDAPVELRLHAHFAVFLVSVAVLVVAVFAELSLLPFELVETCAASISKRCCGDRNEPEWFDSSYRHQRKCSHS